jgi:hypothetical protein
MTREKDFREKQIEAWLKEPTSPEEAYRHKLLIANHLNKDLAIDKFISDAIPQAMLLYEVYLKAAPKGRANLQMQRHLGKRKDAVTAHYDQNRAQFPLVIRNMIEAEDLYKLTPQQERRDFTVKLVEKMLKHWIPMHKVENLIDTLRSKIKKLS